MTAPAALAPLDQAVRRRRASLFALILVVGLGLASWVTRTPAIRDAVDASTAQMGLILFGLSIGSMIGVLSSGPLVARFGARPIALTGTVLVISGVAVAGTSTAVPAALGVFAGLLLFGLGGGLGEIALNVDAADIERITGRIVLPYLHGCFSLGTVIGALAGIGMTAIDFPVIWHLLIVAAVLVGLLVWGAPGLTAGIGRTDHDPAAAAQRAARKGPSVWRDPLVLAIGVVVLAMAFAEGSANDWLPLLMVDGHGMSEALSSFVFAAFAAMMTVGRFVGGIVVDRFGRGLVLRVSAVLAIVGILVVSFAPNLVLACSAVVLWGLGASLGFPVAISAAGDSDDRPAERVSAVATSGYLAFLVGPPLLGFIGEHIGLQRAMLVVVGILIVGAIATLAIKPAAKVDDGE